MKVLMLFADGVGIGRKDPGVNPMFRAVLPGLRSLLGGGIPSTRLRPAGPPTASLVPLDATLGVPGLPQSGTGQTALFTGVNGARLIGKHFGPYPFSTLRPVIAGHNIFRRFLAAGARPCFANAFPERFFAYMREHETRLTVTSRSCLTARIPLRTVRELADGEAVSADITGEGWQKLGHPEIHPVDPAEAGRRLVRLLGSNDFVLFEYWLTDRAGHAQNMEQAVEVLERFDRMLAGILETIDFRTTLLLITSDHGNIEDLSVKTHTRNKVPALLAGRHQRRVAERLCARRPDLTTITPALLHLFDRQ